MVTQLVHDRDSHLARDRLRRCVGAFQRAAEDRDPVWRDEVVVRSTPRPRHTLVQPEQRLLAVIPGALMRVGIAPPQRQLLRRWFVFDDDLDVVEHSDDLGREAVQGTNDDALEPLPARLCDTTPDAVTHEVNSTSFGLFSPVLHSPSLCTYTSATPARSRFSAGSNMSRQVRRSNENWTIEPPCRLHDGPAL